MATRLTVVLSQSPGNSVLSGKCAIRDAESVVAELIGLAGIDLTLIASLDTITESSTDHLTLSSISGDFAMLDWQTPELIVSSLQRNHVIGLRTPHPSDREAPIPVAGQRRVYVFDLTQFTDTASLRECIEQLHQQRQVKTFSLDALAPRTKAEKSTVHKRIEADVHGPVDIGVSIVSNQTLSCESSDGGMSIQNDMSEEEQDARITRLVDQLDDFDS